MPIRFVQPPAESQQALVQGLESLRKDVKHVDRSLTRSTEESRQLQHSVYTIDLNALADGAGLDQAKLTGYRYLIADGNEVRAAVDVATDESQGSHSFHSWNEGDFVTGTTETVEAAAQMKAVQQGSYELRMMNLPQIFVKAIWLHNDEDEEDILIPIKPAPQGFDAGEPYPAAKFLELAREAAQEALSFDNSPPTP